MLERTESPACPASAWPLSGPPFPHLHDESVGLAACGSGLISRALPKTRALPGARQGAAPQQQAEARMYTNPPGLLCLLVVPLCSQPPFPKGPAEV